MAKSNHTFRLSDSTRTKLDIVKIDLQSIERQRLTYDDVLSYLADLAQREMNTDER